ncbi:MAG: hypothetical protein ACO1NO_04655 [Burkholderiaceae bacterium]
MNMRSRAPNGAGPHSPVDPFARQAAASAPANQHSVSNNAWDDYSATHGAHAYGEPFTHDSNPLESALRASEHPHIPRSGQSTTSANANDAGRQSHAPGFDPFAQHFAAHGGPGQPFHPDAYTHASGMPPEDDSVSPVHVALIVLILLAGLAIGIWRSWWVDEKLETVAAKNPVAAGAPSVAALDDASSLQSSIDRAYIPPALLPEEHRAAESSKKDNAAGLAIDPGPASKASASAAVPQTSLTPEVPPKSSEEASSKALTKQAGSENAPNPLDPSPEQADSKSDKKRKPAKAASSQKLTSSTKKERIKEIDRVRTQAFSETSKDRVGERKSRPPESSIGPQSQRRSSHRASKVAQTLVTKSQYARCERIDHIIRREKCKWELCNNQWGKGACPSFKHDRPFLF